MGAVLWPYLWAGLVVAVIGLGMMYRGLWGDRARGRRRCGKCWYDMKGLETLRCPECGRVARSERGLHRGRRRWMLILPGVLLLVLGAAVTAAPWLARAQWIENAPRPVLILAMYITDGSDTRLRDEFDNRRAGVARMPLSYITASRFATGAGAAPPGPPPLLQSELTWIENWCVRRVAIGMVTRPLGSAPASSWGWSNTYSSDSLRPRSWLCWLGNDGAPAVDDLIAIAHSGVEDTYRIRALDVLAHMGLRKREVIEHFVSIAKGPDAVDVRLQAIGCLAWVGEQSDRCSPTMRALMADAERPIRSAVVGQMVAFFKSDSTLVDDVIARLAREPDGALRHYIVSTLLHVDGRCGELREVYERVMRGDPHASARRGALQGLGICSRNVEELRGYAAEGMRDSDFCVRLSALQMVLDLGSRGVEALPAVRPLRNDPNVSVREMAERVERELGER